MSPEDAALEGEKPEANRQILQTQGSSADKHRPQSGAGCPAREQELLINGPEAVSQLWSLLSTL